MSFHPKFGPVATILMVLGITGLSGLAGLSASDWQKGSQQTVYVRSIRMSISAIDCNPLM